VKSSSAQKTQSQNLFKKADNLFAPIQKTEETSSVPSSLFSQTSASLFKKTDTLFAPSIKNTEGKLETKHSTSSLFSSAPSSSGSSLFSLGSSNRPSFSLQKPTPKDTKIGEESRNSLFSSTKKADSGLGPGNLFSSNTSEKTVVKVFTTTEDPAKRKAFLFLNKFESDVLFKVENEELPAHKYILSEKCRFFKNMFASKVLGFG